jgi:hypothetical protein
MVNPRPREYGSRCGTPQFAMALLVVDGNQHAQSRWLETLASALLISRCSRRLIRYRHFTGD